MPWLVHEGRVLSSLEIAESRRDRRVGLLGRDGIDGAMLLRPARSVHTMKMRFAIDIAHLDRDLVVLSTTTMSPWRSVRGRHGRQPSSRPKRVRSAGGASSAACNWRYANDRCPHTGVDPDWQPR